MNENDPIALGVASSDWNGYIDDAGNIRRPGTRGWCVSTATGDAIFHPPHDSKAFRFVTPSEPVVRHYGALGVC